MTPAPIWHSVPEVPADLGGTAVAIGNYDGVHRGHQEVLGLLARAARERGLRPVAVTFHPHPRHVMGTPGDPPLLTSYAERDRLLLENGAEGVLDLPFTWEFAQHSAEEFVLRFLVEGLGARAVVLGRDTRFGRGNEGGFDMMQELGRRHGFDALLVEDVGPAHCDGRVSSSIIREALLSGDVARAEELLGRPHRVTDTVRGGFRRGRTMGFPTANLGPAPEGLVPADGVYAAYLTVLEQHPSNAAAHPPLERRACTVSIGTNPTFRENPDDPAPRMVEAHVLDDLDLELYGDLVRLEFIAYQRPTLCFDGMEALVEQMHEDVAVTRRTLAERASRAGAPSW
ncbi:bifunctional riboflavin kinase/FAD synthetase [Brachybacterium sp. EF45031]|nr:bifunctional riboflavin kinase/FAD synthetase [Brachybacterium sillae]